MKPIYFPFTCISDLSVQVISAIFGQIIIYRPSSQDLSESMQKMAQKGILDIQIPLKNDENKFNAILKDYKSWLSLHIGDKKGMMSFFKTQAGKIPFFDDTFTAQIKTDIKKKIQQKQPETKPDPVLTARIFLQIAQQFDTHNLEINQKLIAVDEIQQNLIENIKGNIDDLAIKNAKRNLSLFPDPGTYMTAKRIKAWSLLMQHNKHNSGLFVTDSRSAFEYLIDKASMSEIIADFDSICLPENNAENTDKWRNDFIEQLETAAKNPFTSSKPNLADPCFKENSNTKADVTIAIVPGETPYEFFAGCSEYNHLEVKANSQFQNTLLGLVEIRN